jgi:hypothetical protein
MIPIRAHRSRGSCERLEGGASIVKGFIFSEFVDYAASAFPDAIGTELRGLRHDGARAYPHAELLDLVARVARATALPAGELLRRFGMHLFGRFVAIYPVFFVELDSAFAFLGEINGNVHAEVQKLHPDAQFPRFECTADGDRRLVMGYRSSRPLADLAEGLIRGCVAYFGETIELTREDLAPGDGTAARFVLTRTASAGSPPGY